MTLFVQVKEGNGSTGPTPNDFFPWINCDDAEGNKPGNLTAGLIAHRFLRDRGGVLPGEKITFTIFSYSENCPKHPNGRPKMVNALTMTAAKEEMP